MIESATSVAIEPIVKSLLVNLPVEAAFRLFTQETNRWWPLATHSVFGKEAAGCHLEGRVGGRFYEIHQDGRQSDWGQVLVWEPPARMALTFHPGRAPDQATELEITFQTESKGTRLTLIHRGWERCAPEVRARRDGYERGWDHVLQQYLSQAAAAK